MTKETTLYIRWHCFALNLAISNNRLLLASVYPFRTDNCEIHWRLIKNTLKNKRRRTCSVVLSSVYVVFCNPIMKHAFCLRFAYSLTMEYSVAREAAIITLIPLCKIAFVYTVNADTPLTVTMHQASMSKSTVCKVNSRRPLCSFPFFVL